MATNYDLTTIPNRGHQIYQNKEEGYAYTHTIDIGADMATHAAGDSAYVIPIPAKSVVWGVAANVNTVSGVSSSTVNIGDSGSATQYLSALSCTSVTGTMSASTTQKIYNSADNLIVTLGTTPPTAGVITLTMFMSKLTPSA